MSAVLPLDTTGFTYTVDPNTGMHRTAADTQAIECGGVDVLTATSTGVSITGTFAVSVAFTVAGNPLTMIGEVRLWSGVTAPALWQICVGTTLLRATYPDLWTFAANQIANGNLLFTNGNGTTTFTIPDTSGRVPAGRDIGTNRLTATTMTPNGSTLGAVSANNQTVTLAANQIPAGVPSSNAAQGISVSSARNIPSTAGVVSDQPAPTTAGGHVPATNSGGGDWSGINTMSGNNNIAVTSTNASLQPVPNVQPTVLFHFIIYAGA
jgi:microcystin-dependent protein